MTKISSKKRSVSSPETTDDKPEQIQFEGLGSVPEHDQTTTKTRSTRKNPPSGGNDSPPKQSRSDPVKTKPDPLPDSQLSLLEPNPVTTETESSAPQKTDKTASNISPTQPSTTTSPSSRSHPKTKKKTATPTRPKTPTARTKRRATPVGGSTKKARTNRKTTARNTRTSHTARTARTARTTRPRTSQPTTVLEKPSSPPLNLASVAKTSRTVLPSPHNQSTDIVAVTDTAPEEANPAIAKLLLEWSKNSVTPQEGLVAHYAIDARSAQHRQPEDPFPQPLQEYLNQHGINLYNHQTEAIESIRTGQDTVVAASTSSGKTLCYQLPLLEHVLQNPQATGLLMYPTKALAQDQLRSLRAFGIRNIKVDTYDGDTSPEQRRRIRKQSHLVLTNPDMLHTAILPNHHLWKEFFANLHLVVIDEMHTMRGIFGTHVSLILRRMLRICELYGNPDPIIVFTSATIANPKQLAQLLSGREQVKVVDRDTSPHGQRWIALWNPPKLEEDSNRRQSARAATIGLLAETVKSQLPTIVFARSRKDTELIYRGALDWLPPEFAEKISPYRGGYRPEQRREIERRFFSHELLGIIATNALELGVDVGSLDVVLMSGFPGTMASFRQQSGRAGRRRSQSMVVLVASDNALDQYFMTHPDELISRQSEGAIVNPDNPTILKQQLGCAAYELPLNKAMDGHYFGELFHELTDELLTEEQLEILDTKDNEAVQLGWTGTPADHPSGAVNIRTAGEVSYTLMDRNIPLETNEKSRVLRENHPGAVFLHQGDSFVVRNINHRTKIVRVKKKTVNYYTQAGTDIDVSIEEEQECQRWGSMSIKLGKVMVESQVTGYKKVDKTTRKVIEIVDFEDYPSTQLLTAAVWWEIPAPLIATAGISDPLAALHAAEHTSISMMPLVAASERWDVGGLSTGQHAQTGHPTFFIYESYPGGAGIASLLYERGKRLIQATLNAITECSCREGCPSCIQSPKCGNYNDTLSKGGAVQLLRLMLTQSELPPAPEPVAPKTLGPGTKKARKAKTAPKPALTAAAQVIPHNRTV